LTICSTSADRSASSASLVRRGEHPASVLNAVIDSDLRVANGCAKSAASAATRDVVGSVNMHPIAYEEKIKFPQRITYLRPGPVKGSGGGMNNRRRSQEPAA
jgi:hypothetical protein